MRYPLFVRRDLDAFFGLAINNLVDLIIIATVGRTLLQLPDELIFGRILPGAGLSLLVGNLYYAWQAQQLAKAEGRSDVTAQPFGLNTPTVFLFLYLVMYPVYVRTHDPELAWKVGVAACFLSGVIEAAGAFVGATLQRITPRSALLATLAGAALAYIALLPTLDLFARPVVGLVPLAIILLGYFARVRLPLNLPAGLVAVVVGSALAWATGQMHAEAIAPAAASFGLYLPHPSLGAVLAGLPDVLPFLSAVAPLAVMNFMGTLQCVESAAAAGDRFPPFPTMIVNGVATMVGALLGSCFPTTVYIGHPAWKALGARQGYSILNGVVITLVCTTGLMGLVLAIVPKESASAILLFVGLVITAQAFEVTAPKHLPGRGVRARAAPGRVGDGDPRHARHRRGHVGPGDRRRRHPEGRAQLHGPAHAGPGLARDVDDAVRDDDRAHRPPPEVGRRLGRRGRSALVARPDARRARRLGRGARLPRSATR